MKKLLTIGLLLVLVSYASFASGSKEIKMYIDFDQNDIITDGRLDGMWVQNGNGGGVIWTATYTFNGSEFLYEIHSTSKPPLPTFQTYHGTFILTSTHIHFEANQDNWPYSHPYTKWSQKYELSGNVLNLSQTKPYGFQNGRFIKE
ncbi:MAG: hypothetical protein FWC19_06780 [Treponema sp.]|nr:hypothetical protein [Treponema sp.]MCL2272490.1 hypothetical protein [Treponema sp.]